MLRYRIDILAALKEKGVTTYYIKKNKVFGAEDVQKLRRGEMLGIKNLDRLCALLRMQPGKIIEWIPDPAEKEAESNR